MYLIQTLTTMKTQDSYVSRNHFNEEIFDLIEEYLENSDSFTDEVLAVHKKSKELQLISPNKINEDWDTYPISKFIRKEADGIGLETDVDATLDLADSYFFLR